MRAARSQLRRAALSSSGASATARASAFSSDSTCWMVVRAATSGRAQGDDAAACLDAGQRSQDEAPALVLQRGVAGQQAEPVAGTDQRFQDAQVGVELGADRRRIGLHLDLPEDGVEGEALGTPIQG